MLLPGPRNDRGARLSAVPGKDAWAEPDVRRWEQPGAPGAVLSRERPARGGRAHPALCARHPLRLAENNRSGTPSRLPSRREPNFLYLGRGGGLYAKGARPGAPSRLQPGRGWSAEAGPSPSPLRPGRPPGVAGTAGPGRALQLPQDGTPAPARRLLPPPGRSRCSTRRSVASRGAGCQAAEFRVPSASQLSSSGVLVCCPVLRAAARAAMAVSYPLPNEEDKPRAGER